MAAEGHRPICQDTGIGMVFIKVGMNVTWPDATMSIQKMIDEGVRRAYANPDNPLRASVLADPAGARKNTKDNTPAVVHFEIVEGHHVEVICAAKGGGSKPSPSSPCSTRPTTWSTGCSRRSPKWAPAGARRASSASASAARRKGHAAGQGIDHGAGGHPRTEGARPQTRAEELRLELMERSTRWASAPRASAA
jgi:fumarate hydratase class I